MEKRTFDNGSVESWGQMAQVAQGFAGASYGLGVGAFRIWSSRGVGVM